VLAVRLHAVLVLDVGDEAVVGTGWVFDDSHAAVRLDQLVRMMYKKNGKMKEIMFLIYVDIYSENVCIEL
jgi:hypothetical protein